MQKRRQALDRRKNVKRTQTGNLNGVRRGNPFVAAAAGEHLTNGGVWIIVGSATTQSPLRSNRIISCVVGGKSSERQPEGECWGKENKVRVGGWWLKQIEMNGFSFRDNYFAEVKAAGVGGGRSVSFRLSGCCGCGGVINFQFIVFVNIFGGSSRFIVVMMKR